MKRIVAFPYIGGKVKMKEKIYELIPEHKVWCEPFLGGASITLNKKPSMVEVINDVNNDIVDFFLTVKNHHDEIYDYLLNIPYSRYLYQETLKKWKTGWRPTKKIEKVAIWFFLQRAAFSGTFGRGFGCSGVRNPAASFSLSVDNLFKIRDRLRKVIIENKDYGEIISFFDSENTVFYLDPPYWIDQKVVNDYYPGGQNFDHYRLADILNKIKGKAILSYYEHPELEKLYSTWNKKVYNMVKSSVGIKVHQTNTTRPKSQEILYFNF